MITTRGVIDESAPKKTWNRNGKRHPMIESVEIKNFRCFEKLKVNDLGRINVIVGENAAGKTSLLEAIFFSQHSSPPEVQLRFRNWRGVGPPEIKFNRAGYEAFWKDLFYRNDQARRIEIDVKGTPENSRRVSAYYDPNEPVSIQVPLPQDPAQGPLQKNDSSAIRPITIEFARGTDDPVVMKPELVLGGFSVRAIAFGAPAAFYPAAIATSIGPREAADQFSALSTKGEADRLIKVVKAVFPQISNLSPESFSGVWMLHCNVPGMKEKLPIGLVSSGIHKLITILLGICATPNGTVLIDELDNGFYYKALPKVWEALLRFSQEFNVQLFASTHSQECLNALRPTIRKNRDDFRLIRMEVKGTKRVAPVFSGKSFEAALDTATEVR